jgi:hypothetical protein
LRKGDSSALAVSGSCGISLQGSFRLDSRLRHNLCQTQELGAYSQAFSFSRILVDFKTHAAGVQLEIDHAALPGNYR